MKEEPEARQNQGDPDGNTSWHALQSTDVAARLDVEFRTGLGVEQVNARRRLYGANRLAETPPRSALLVFIAQFKSLLIVILLVAAALAGALGAVKDASVILAVVVLNAILGFYQEFRAERSLLALKTMLPRLARVRRAGTVQQIPTEQLVPGDLVLLEAGERVPADGRIAEAVTLQIDESGLTGESLPVSKVSEETLPPGAALADQRNMAFMNTIVTRGRGELVVTAIGMATSMGMLSRELAEAKEPPSPLELQLNQLGKRLAMVALGLVGVLVMIELSQREPFAHIIIEAISLAVASIPEGLPAVVTITLALGMHRMARRGAIIKRLSSVETLGCATVICSDKTGTLTVNQMTVRSVFFRGRWFSVSGEGYRPLGEISADDSGSLPDLEALMQPAVLCNDSRLRDGELIGDPTEGALLALATKGGVDSEHMRQRLPRIAEIPFDSAHKYMATFHHDETNVRLFVKGAPDILLEKCMSCSGADSGLLFDQQRQEIKAAYDRMASQGLRGILVASRNLLVGDFDPAQSLLPHVRDLAFVSLLGMMDPPRPEVKEAIAQCHHAGIQVKMITGDHPGTAAAIASELGLTGRVISGAELDRLKPEELAAQIGELSVFARVVPQQKVKIVMALKAKGHVVAMTGDGVNDAPALKSADIGVAMGIAGTEVAKEAATMVLTDDNFATIVRAVREGRTLYDNIVKFIRFQLSTTMGAMLTVFGASIIGLPDPFTPIQILWVAMIMDGPPAVALALDSARFGIMSEPPRRPVEPILGLHRLSHILGYGLIMMSGTLGVLWVATRTGTAEHALTLAFTTFVLFQVFNAFNARVERGTTFNKRFFTNPLLWVSLGVVFFLQIVAVYWAPAQAIIGTVSLDASDWFVCCGVASSILLLEEARKLLVTLLSPCMELRN